MLSPKRSLCWAGMIMTSLLSNFRNYVGSGFSSFNGFDARNRESGVSGDCRLGCLKSWPAGLSEGVVVAE